MLSTSAGKEADARRLGAHKFALTRDAAQMKELAGYFDFIIDTVSAEHDYNLYIRLLDTNGVMICVGAPPTPAQVAVFGLLGAAQPRGIRHRGIPKRGDASYCDEHASHGRS